MDSSRPDAASIEGVARLIRHGVVAAIPTDTLYGLAADPFNIEAVGRVFVVKGRMAQRALPLVAADLEQACEWLGELPPVGLRLAAHFWPGALTLVVAAPKRLAPGVTGGRSTVGVRVPAHAVTRALCAACGHRR